MVLYGFVTSALLIVCFVELFCPEVSDIVQGDLDIRAIMALSDVVHSQVMRYQTHFVSASLPPVELSFLKILCYVCYFLNQVAYHGLDLCEILKVVVEIWCSDLGWIINKSISKSINYLVGWCFDNENVEPFCY